MTPAADALHNLIHHLGKGERRYFKLFAQPHVKQGRSIHLLLFDLLAGMDVYDEEAFQRAASKLGLPKRISAAKHQLRKLILKALRAYHNQDSGPHELGNRLQDIQILHQLGLSDQAEKVWRLAIKKARKEEMHLRVLELLDWELELLRSLQPEDMVARMHQNQLLRSHALQELSDEKELHGLYMQSQVLGKLHMRQPEAFKAAMAPILASSTMGAPPLSLLSRIYRGHILGIYPLILGQYGEAVRVFMDFQPIWERQPEMRLRHPVVYLLFQLNLLNACFFAERTDLLETYLPQVRAMLPTFGGAMIHEQRRVYQLELMYRMNFGVFEEGRELVREVQAWIREHQHLLSMQEIYSLHYNCSVFYFLSGEFSRAQKQVSTLLNLGRPGTRTDLYDFALVFQLVLYLQKEDLELLSYRLRSTKRLLDTDGAIGHYHQQLLRFFAQALNQPLAERRTAARALRKQLLADEDSFEGRLPAGYHEMLFWLESLSSGNSIRDIYVLALTERRKRP